MIISFARLEKGRTMAEFCIHEKHGGMCEKTDTYCNLGACPYEDLKEYAPVKRGTISVREKLVELLSQSQSYGKILCGASLMSVRNDVVADHLIDSGVTVQEWISVNDRLPEDDSDVLA